MSKFSTGAHEAVLRRVRDIPSLPEVVNKIIDIMSTPNAPASEIAQLVSYDPGLTSKVLRMVNSAAYGVQRQISSIQHAIMILGFNTVRGLVMSASIFKMFEENTSGKGLNHKEFWQHSMGTAVATRFLCGRIHVPDSDDAFSAGMLHDIGKVVLDVYFPNDYVQVLDMARKRKIMFHGKKFHNLEYEALQTTHTDIGSFLAKKWKLPTTISNVITYHHKPEEADSCESLVHLVALANEFSIVQFHHHGIFSRSLFSDYLVEYFDLEDDKLQALQKELSGEFDGVEDLLKSLSSS